jgi:hypothetical protein
MLASSEPPKLNPAAHCVRKEIKLYNSIGPDPKVVRMFMAEKGIELPMVEVPQEKRKWLGRPMDGRSLICVNPMTTADILRFASVDLFARGGQSLNPDLSNVGAWYERMNARPGAAA